MLEVRSEAGAPAWAGRLTLSINKALRGLAWPADPIRIAEVATAAELPPAGDWRAGLVFVASIQRLAVSTGTNWIRTDTGAAL